MEPEKEVSLLDVIREYLLKAKQLYKKTRFYAKT